MQQMQLSMGRTLKMPKNVPKLQNPKMGRPQRNNINGKTFGRLTVIGHCGVIPCGKVDCHIWLTKCSCGNFVMLHYTSLARGLTKSCGCYHRDITVKPNAKKRMYRAEYAAWSCAKTRCLNPRIKHFGRYGGRGIEFRFNSFEDFLEEVGRKPSPKHSLDRINNDGHYEKGNVRWATVTEQVNNQRCTRYLTIDGETQALSIWARQAKVPRSRVWDRIAKQWCHKCAVFNALRVPCEHQTRLF